MWGLLIPLCVDPSVVWLGKLGVVEWAVVMWWDSCPVCSSVAVRLAHSAFHLSKFLFECLVLYSHLFSGVLVFCLH